MGGWICSHMNPALKPLDPCCILHLQCLFSRPPPPKSLSNSPASVPNIRFPLTICSLQMTSPGNLFPRPGKVPLRATEEVIQLLSRAVLPKKGGPLMSDLCVCCDMSLLKTADETLKDQRKSWTLKVKGHSWSRGCGFGWANLKQQTAP